MGEVRKHDIRNHWLFQFVRENMEKRDRASNKVLEDIDLSEQRATEVETLTKNYKEIEKAKIDMDAKIKEYHLYEVTDSI